MYFLKANEEQLKAVLYDTQNLTLFPGGATVAKNSRSIRQGDILARNTSTKRILVAKKSHLQVASGTNATAIQVDDAHAFAVGDVITVGTAANLTITAISYENNTITVTVAGAQVINARVYVVANAQGAGIGVALLPLRDKGAIYEGVPALSSVVGDELYGACALTGRFKLDKLLNFDTGIATNSLHADLGGNVNADLNKGDGLYIINNVPSNF